MPDLTPQLRALLQAIIPCAQGQYPAQEAAFPCAVTTFRISAWTSGP